MSYGHVGNVFHCERLHHNDHRPKNGANLQIGPDAVPLVYSGFSSVIVVMASGYWSSSCRMSDKVTRR